MHCVPIGPYSWSFVCKFSPCILILSVQLDWSFVLAYTVHRVPIAPYTCMWQRITLYLPQHIPMHSPHNLSLVERCVKTLSYLAQPPIILYVSAITAYADFVSFCPQDDMECVIMPSYWFTHPYACVYVVQMALYKS